MTVRIGEKQYESSFTESSWILKNGNETLDIPLSRIYNYFGNKVYGKTDTFTIFLAIAGIIWITPWIAAVFVLPVLYFWHHAKRVRMDTEQGAIYVILNDMKEKNEFLKECKKHIEIQRWKNFKFGMVGVPNEQGFFSKFFNKG